MPAAPWNQNLKRGIASGKKDGKMQEEQGGREKKKKKKVQRGRRRRIKKDFTSAELESSLDTRALEKRERRERGSKSKGR